MEHRKAALSLLFLVVLASGCGDSGTQSEGSQALNVEGPELSRHDIFAGSDINARLKVGNAGEMEGTLVVGENGRKVMTDYCQDIFTIEEFTSRSRGEDLGDSYRIQPGQNVNMNWKLSSTTSNVPLNGYNCDLKFKAPFDYSVEAFRQIQVKEPDTSTGEPEIASKSSQGPMKIEIETVGSSSDQGSPVFFKGDDITLLLQFINEEPEEGAYRGLMEIDEPEVDVTGASLEDSCELEQMKLYEGKSQVFQCGLDVSLDDTPSKIVEISVDADYTYIRDLGSQSVEVKYGG